MRPDYNKLYYFTENFALWAGALQAGEIDDIDIQQEYALKCGEYRPRQSIRFGWRQGSRVRDVIWTTSSMFLISKQFRDILRKNAFTGWSTYPAKTYDREGRLLRGYTGLAITGRAGSVDNTRSKKVWRGPAVDEGPRFQCYVGMFFENDEWDGSDLCVIGWAGGPVVTERVKNTLEESDLDIKNVVFEKLTTYERRV